VTVTALPFSSNAIAIRGPASSDPSRNVEVPRSSPS
jgi:hypothetical protein